MQLVYLNTRENAVEMLREASGGKGYDDVLVFAPVPAVIEQADAVLGFDGCLNFFAGPTNPKLSANFNFYDVHYSAHHIVGTSGGNTDDMREALRMIAEGKLNPSGMITHVGGLDAVAEATVNLPSIPGGKKLIYTHIAMELTAIEDFAKKGETRPDVPPSGGNLPREQQPLVRRSRSLSAGPRAADLIPRVCGSRAQAFPAPASLDGRRPRRADKIPRERNAAANLRRAGRAP